MSYQDSGTTWYLAQCKPNSHRIAERNLARQGFKTFLPLHKEASRVRGKFTLQVPPVSRLSFCGPRYAAWALA